MKIYTFSEENIKEIQGREAEIFEKYKKYIESKYLQLFIAQNYTLKIDLAWCNWRKKLINQQEAIPIENGYECFVGCTVQKDGKDLILPSDDEYEWWYVSTSWQITEAETYWFKKRIKLFDEVFYDEVDEDMGELLEAIGEGNARKCY